MSQRYARELRPSAVAVGALYILATAAGVAALLAGAPTTLAAMAGARAAVLLSTLAQVVMALSVTGVAMMLYPVLVGDAGTPIGKGLALWYAATRITEGALFLVAAAVPAVMLAMSAGMTSAPAGEAAAYQAMGTTLSLVAQYAMVAGQTVFCVGALILYWMLLVSGRVPRWIAVWGLIAAPLMLVAGFTLPLTNDPNSTVSSILYAPMGVQEMVMAVWMIGWGFRPKHVRADGIRAVPSSKVGVSHV